MAITLNKEYGIVQYRGTIAHHTLQRLVFESDNPAKVIDELERRQQTVTDQEGYSIVIRSLDGASLHTV